MSAGTSPSARMIIVLTLIAALSGGILAAWDSFTAPRIAYHREQALKAAIAEVLPPYEKYTTSTIAGMTFYIARTGDSLIGVAFEAQGNGFQGPISMMVGMNPNLNQLTGLKILEQLETPGLGTKIVDDPSNRVDAGWFTTQFVDLNPNPRIAVIKNARPTKSNEVQAITGATISSKAVVRILNQYIESARQAFQSNGGVIHG